ncbi:MAG: hypothetical protein IJU16_01845 [Clostridia bacterium]|nr:hypothetical protein [Clostridia bacterium]
MKQTKILRAAALLLTVLLLLGCVPVAAAAETDAVAYNVADIVDSVKVVGRTSIVGSSLAVHTTGAGIAFYSECSGDIRLKLTTKNMFGAQYFTVWVDGERSRLTVDNGTTSQRSKKVTLAEDLEAGLHRIEIYRQTEEINGSCLFDELIINGTLTPLPDAPMLIEFIGDSLTAGYGALGVPSKGKVIDHPEGQDGTQTYAYLTAQALGMDFQACCTSGYGLLAGWNNGDANLLNMYAYTAYHNNAMTGNEMWAFARPADIVVINLGSNDRAVGRGKGVNEKTFEEAVKSMTELIREKNPDAKVVWVTGLGGNAFKAQMEDAMDSFGGAENGYYFCQLPEGNSGAAGHPSVKEHIAAGEVLTAFLRDNVLPEDYEAAFVSAEDMEALIEGASNSEARTIAEVELATFRQNGGVSKATLTAAYQALKEASGMPAYMPWVFCGLAVLLIVAATVLICVLYQPKKKEMPQGKENEDE